MRMGMVRKQNKALTLEIVTAMTEVAEDKWMSAMTETLQEEVESVICFMLISFRAGLRGKETPLTAIGGLLAFWDKTREESDPFVMITLQGRFKGEVDARWHCIPIADKTRSRIPFRLWLERMLHRQVNLKGRSACWLFVDKKGGRAKFGAYD